MQAQPPGKTDGSLRVNFFLPRPGFMRREVTIICLTLAVWALLTFGFHLYLIFCPQARIPDRTIFGMPVHFWFSGQFLIFWFIAVSVVFNLLIDWLTDSYRRRRGGP